MAPNRLDKVAIDPILHAAGRGRRTLYSAVEPFDRILLPVGDGHEIYVEQSGNPAGIPVIFLHGGPGGGTSPVQRRFFDSHAYRIIMFDQRGCGRSRPHASLKDNTTWKLIEDMEAIRRRLKIRRWMLFGGSWGSTLALAYAQTHPERVSAMVLRGIFLMRQQEIDWFYKSGTNAIFPESWEHFVSIIPEDERHDLISAYFRRLTSRNDAVRLEAAKRWSRWEASSVSLVPDDRHGRQAGADRFALAFARIECHYFVNRGFFERDDQLLVNAGILADIPMVIVQGRYDVICPPRSAFELKRACPHADLRLVPVAGHSAFEPGIIHELIDATDGFRHLVTTPA